MPVILFGLLIAFLITIVFEWGMDYLGTRSAQSEVIGSVNGRPVSYREFSELVRSMSENQKEQTGKEPDDNALRQIREQAWQSIVTQRVVEDQITAMGITVTDQEIVDWVRGDNPPEDLRRNFVDSTGQFRKDLYDQFLANPNQFLRDPEGSDPAYGTRWLADYERSLRVRRSQEKLQSIVLASVRATEGEVFSRFAEQSQSYEAAYALFDANTLVKDADVEVTDADLRTYYQDNLEQYKIAASRTLKYVFFPELPSADDTLARRSEIEDAAKKAREGIDFIELTGMYGEKADSGVFFRHGELAPALETVAFAAGVGDVVGPVLEGRGYHLMKVLEQRKGTTEFVHASHILFTVDPAKDTTEIKKTAQRVAQEVRQGKDFAALARQYSQDQATGARGGDLGWFSKGRMVKAFEEACFSTKPGGIAGPIRTQFGWHIIKVHGRDARDLKISSIVVPVEPSSQTRNDIFQRAQDFAYNAGQTDFAKEAQSTGLEVKEATIQEKGGVIPGLGVNESVSRWAFSGGVGEISEPYSFGKGYAVLVVAEVKEEGFRPLEELKETIRPIALRKKKAEKAVEIAAGLRSSLANGDSLAKLATLRPDLAVQQTGKFTMMGGVPGLGRDPAFLGAVAGLEPGQISRATEAVRGAYLVQLLARTPVDSAVFASQRESLRNQILQEKRNRFLSEWLEKKKADADIEDKRDLFFR